MHSSFLEKRIYDPWSYFEHDTDDLKIDFDIKQWTV